MGLTVLARRFGWSAPVVLVAVGAGISFLLLGRLAIEPNLILYGLLPPLLFASAIRASLIDMRARRDPILLTSIGLVAFTVVVVGLAAWLLIPAITVAAGLAFGAVVAPTDSVAVDAVTRRARLPRILSTLLDGENLLNDATALAALNAATAAILNTLSPAAIAGNFLLAAGDGGCLRGLLIDAPRAIQDLRRCGPLKRPEMTNRCHLAV